MTAVVWTGLGVDELCSHDRYFRVIITLRH